MWWMNILTFLIVGMMPNVVSAKSNIPPAAEKFAITDRDMTVAIEARLTIDPKVPENAIDVNTQDGVVTLSGTVKTLLGKDRATKIVESVRGVQAIINTIKVSPVPEVDDEVLRTQITNALARDPATDSFDVSVSARQGMVILKGTVDSWQEKQLAGQVTKAVKGVVKLDNRLNVHPDAVRSDEEIEADVVRRLQSNVWIDGKLIGVMVRNGKVTLSGTVGSLAEKYSAFTDAWVSGVIAVNAEPLEVEWWARDDMRRNPGELSRTDEQVQDSIQMAWEYDPRVGSSQIDVNVKEGIVTLTGVVTNLRAKRAAEQDTNNTIGIFRVRNFIKVRPTESIPDDKLKKHVEAAFQEHAWIDRYDIQISVQDGTVFLDGYVDSPVEATQAVQRAEDVKGVRKVVQRLEIETVSNGKNDKEMWYDIMQSIWWDSRLYQETIHAEVENGEVTLTGTVFTLQDLHTLSQIARNAGAVKVHNQVEVKYAPAFLSSKN